MTQSTFEAEAGALDRAATLVAGAHTDLEAMARQLAGRVEGHLAGWNGAGAVAFVQLHQAWQQRHRAIVAILDDLCAALRATDAQASQRDAEARASLSRVALDLGGL